MTIRTRIAAADQILLGRVADACGPGLNRTMHGLGRAADHSVLWIAVAAGLGARRNKWTRRAALRGLASLAIASTAANVGLIAVDAGLPVLVVPADTFNHFAADLGVESPDDAVAALRSGDSVLVDVGTADSAAFLPLARIRLVVAVLLGSLGRCRVYRTWSASSVRVASPRGGPVPLCLDGEATETKPAVRLNKRPRKLLVYRPGTGDGPAQAPGTNQP